MSAGVFAQESHKHEVEVHTEYSGPIVRLGGAAWTFLEKGPGGGPALGSTHLPVWRESRAVCGDRGSNTIQWGHFTG